MVTSLSVFLRVGPSRQITNNSKNQFDVKELGELALSQIELDLEMEIFAGSDEELSETYSASSNDEAAVGNKYYALYPITREHMVPARVLQERLDEETAGALIKQSIHNKSFLNAEKFSDANANYTPKIKVSDVNTGDTNIKGESISLLQWLAPQFIDLDKNKSYDKNTLPDWVYLDETTNNPTRFTEEQLPQAQDSDEKIIGRYAYQIYDTSGLIDLNVTGTKLSDENKSNKSSPHYLDLNLLASNLEVEISGLGAELQSWRQQASQGKEDYVSDWGEGNGWLKPYQNDSQIDQMFLSRQELLKFQKQRPQVFDPKFLPYVTHFSRDLNQPDFRHDPDRPKIAVDKDSGGNDHFGEDEDKINPWLSRIRNADGSPLVQTRFPLDRIDLLKEGEEDESKIEEYFGLVKGDDDKWIYDKANNGKILTLEEVAQAGRDANMAELLKAAIHVGSLGQAGRTKDYEGNDYAYWKEMDTQVDAHILKIMANIIDQWDDDSYPTLIEYTNPNLDDDIHPNLHTQTLAGIEDIPYLLGVRDMPYRVETYGDRVTKPDPITSNGGNRNTSTFQDESILTAYTNFTGVPNSRRSASTLFRVLSVAQPIIWNPHQPSPNKESERPTEFRVTATGGYQSMIDSGSILSIADGIRARPGNSAIPTVFDDIDDDNNWSILGLNLNASNHPHALANPTLNFSGNPLWQPEETYIEFNILETGPASFRDPYALEKPDFPSGSNAEYSGYPGQKVGNGGSQSYRSGAWSLDTDSRNDTTPVFLKHHYRELNFEDITEDSGDEEFIGFYQAEWITNHTFRHVTFYDPTVNSSIPVAGSSANDGNLVTIFRSTFLVHNGNKYELQYKKGGKWITYDFMVDAPINEDDRGETTNSAAYNNDNGSLAPTAKISNTKYETMVNNAYKNLSSTAVALEDNGSIHSDFSSLGSGLGAATGSANLGRNSHAYLKSDPRTQRFGTHLLHVRPWRNNSQTTTLNNGNGYLIGHNVNDADPGNYSYLENGHSPIAYSPNSSLPAQNLYASSGDDADDSWYSDYWNMSDYLKYQFTARKYTNIIPFNPISLLTNTTDNENYYRDPDGVVRRASGAYQQEGIGMMTHEDTITGQVDAASDYKSRPIVLNRPFESLGELAHVFRDIPFKEVDFLNPESADRFLLNIFCLHSDEDYEAPQLRAGRININTASAEVLSTLFAQAAIDYNEELTISEETAKQLGEKVYNYIHKREAADGGENLLMELSEFVGILDAKTKINSEHSQVTFMQELADVFAKAQADSKGPALINLNEVVTARKHVVARALTDNVTTRSWNFTIDLVVEEGSLSRNAESLADFITQGSRRYWVHLSLDRLTGQILDRQIEQVPTSMRLTN